MVVAPAGEELVNARRSGHDLYCEKEFGDVTMYSFIGTILRKAVTIEELVTRHPEGWIVLTQNSRPEKNGLVYENTTIDGKSLEYLGQWGECYIWRWEEIEN